MSGITLTFILPIAGIVVGFLTSWWFARAGKRDAKTQRAMIENAFAAQRGFLIDVQQRGLQSSRSPDTAGGDAVTPVESAVSSSAADVLVRASLGALLNEHGEVSVPQLLNELARALPDATVLSYLEELRKSGRVSWSGDDVRKAVVIKVHPVTTSPVGPGSRNEMDGQ